MQRVRALHTTVSLLRNAPKLARSAAFSRPDSRTPSAAPSSRGSRHRGPPYRKPSSGRSHNAAPSWISVDHVKVKLEQHLDRVWSDPHSKQLSQLATDLGVDPGHLARLANRFARDVGASPDVLECDFDALTAQYVTDGPHDALWSHSLAAFLAYVESSCPASVAAASPSGRRTLSTLHQLARIADSRFAYETYPAARQQRRKLVLHVGPTNSGKTYNALVALSRARTGAYAGPLRLLAHEVFARFNRGQIGTEPARACNLVTGEEQRIVDPEAGLVSCTVEMFPMTRRLQVGVVDEIQMIGDPQRGSAWTMAVVGSLCDELHLCGEESVVELVEKIAHEMGDDVEVKRYQRLSPLVVGDESLRGDLTKIRKGDCLVTFSRSNIFMFKRQIEAKTGLRVAVAYGGLPPEVREEQARAFNAGEYDVLVASDAVGMGLNLKIRRIVFESLHKWDGSAEVRLATPQIKQIAGRAGRYGVHTPVSPSAPDLDAPTSAPAEPETVNGEATTLDADDLPLLRAAMKEPTVQVTRASLTPQFGVFQQIYHLLPASTRMSRIFSLARSITRTKAHYRSTGTHSFGQVGDKIAHVRPLTFQERFTFGSAPVNLRDERVVEALVSYAGDFARGKPIVMEDWGQRVGLFDLLESIDEARHDIKSTRGGGGGGGGQGAGENAAASFSPPARSATQGPQSIFFPTTLQSLESLHRCLTLYLWLSYRFQPIFCDQPRARELRHDVEQAIDFVLGGIRFERVERGKGSKRNKAKFSSAEVQQSVGRV